MHETDARGRIGPFITLLGGSTLRFGVRGGLQYDRINDDYVIKVNNDEVQSSTKFWTQYFGFGAVLIPFAGFGIQGGMTIWNNKQNNSWVPEAYLGMILN